MLPALYILPEVIWVCILPLQEDLFVKLISLHWRNQFSSQEGIVYIRSCCSRYKLNLLKSPDFLKNNLKIVTFFKIQIIRHVIILSKLPKRVTYKKNTPKYLIPFLFLVPPYHSWWLFPLGLTAMINPYGCYLCQKLHGSLSCHNKLYIK